MEASKPISKANMTMIVCNTPINMEWFNHINEEAQKCRMSAHTLASQRIKRYLKMPIKQAVLERNVRPCVLVREILPLVFPGLPDKKHYANHIAEKNRAAMRKRLAGETVYLRVQVRNHEFSTLEFYAKLKGLKGAEQVISKLIEQTSPAMYQAVQKASNNDGDEAVDST